MKKETLLNYLNASQTLYQDPAPHDETEALQYSSQSTEELIHDGGTCFPSSTENDDRKNEAITKSARDPSHAIDIEGNGDNIQNSEDEYFFAEEEFQEYN